MHNLTELQHVSIYLDHLQGVTEYQQGIYTSMSGLLSTL